jgi:hypothetical protein
MKKSLLILFFLLGFAEGTQAQVVKNARNLVIGQHYRLELADGSYRTGIVDSLDGEFVYFTGMASGPDKVYRQGITQARLHPITKRGHFASPHYSRSLFGPSAIPQKKGELYWNNILFEYNTVQYGLTDHLSVGMGGLLITNLVGITNIMPTVKYGYSLDEKNHVAVGMLSTYWNPRFEILDGVGSMTALPFAIYTRGTAESQITAGLGWSYGSAWADGFRTSAWAEFPTLYLAGSHRVSRNWILGGEHYTIINGGGIGTIPLTILYGRSIKPSSSWDFGVVVATLNGFTFGFPMVGTTQRF